MLIQDILVGGGMLSLIGLMLAQGRVQDNRISRVYQRLDEAKEMVEKKYTQKEVCEILHKSLNDSMIEIKCDIKEIKEIVTQLRK